MGRIFPMVDHPFFYDRVFSNFALSFLPSILPFITIFLFFFLGLGEFFSFPFSENFTFPHVHTPIFLGNQV